MTTRILVGDVRERLAEIPDQSVHCCVTSPPYFNLRDYQVAGQIGLEPTLADYLNTLVDVFRDVRRVLRDDGTLWLNIGDSYFGTGKGPTPPTGIHGRNGTPYPTKGVYTHETLKPKDLMLVPERLALALQDDGWWVRSRIIWAKKACMPESVTDRPTNAHEHIWLLTKAARYFYDAEAVREDAEYGRREGGNGIFSRVRQGDPRDSRDTPSVTTSGADPSAGRNQRNVWHLGPEPFPDAHFATFVTEIPRRAIKAGTSEHGCCEACGAPWVRRIVREETGEVQRKGASWDLGEGAHGSFHREGRAPVVEMAPVFRTSTIGWAPSCQCDAGVIPCTVLDPFGGSGTTGMVADQLGRDCILVELNPEYAAMCERRIRGDAPMFADVTIETASCAGYIDSEVA